MNKFKLIFASASLFALSCVAEVKNTDKNSEPHIVATYEGIKVTNVEVGKEFKDQLEAQKQTFDGLNKSSKEMLVKSYVEGKLLDREIATSGLDKTPDFIAKQEELKKGLLRKEFITNYLKQNVTEAKFEESYKKYVTDITGKDQYKVSHILVANEDEAKKVKAELNSKTDNFQALVRKYSLDENSKVAIDENKKQSSGLLGYFVKGQLPPEFDEKVF